MRTHTLLITFLITYMHCSSVIIPQIQGNFRALLLNIFKRKAYLIDIKAENPGAPSTSANL